MEPPFFYDQICYLLNSCILYLKYLYPAFLPPIDNILNAWCIILQFADIRLNSIQSKFGRIIISFFQCSCCKRNCWCYLCDKLMYQHKIESNVLSNINLNISVKSTSTDDIGEKDNNKIPTKCATNTITSKKPALKDMITMTNESAFTMPGISVNLTIPENFENDASNIPSFDLAGISETAGDTPKLMNPRSARQILAITPADSMCNVQNHSYNQTLTSDIPRIC